MSNFIYNSYCVEHPGVVRVYQTENERPPAAPARRVIDLLRSGYRAWVASRQQAYADERVWNAALRDARLMADLARAMDRQGNLVK